MVLIKIINQYFFGDYIAYKEESGRNCLRINIFHQQIRTDFLNLGLKNNDCGRSLPPRKDELFRHFLRGFIDGDGHISDIYPKVSIAGRMNFLEQIGIKLNSLGFKNAYITRESQKSAKKEQSTNTALLIFINFIISQFISFYIKTVTFIYPGNMMRLIAGSQPLNTKLNF